MQKCVPEELLGSFERPALKHRDSGIECTAKVTDGTLEIP